MINLEEIELMDLVIHRVGNKQQDEGYVLSREACNIEDETVNGTLTDYFLSSFKLTDYYQFVHHADLEMNEIFNFCQQVFEDKSLFFEQTVSISKHLYEASDHPKIKAGEVYFAYFENCLIEDEVVEAIGIFKSENKDTFLQFDENHKRIGIKIQEGIHTKKLDKGAIIFNTMKEDGFRVLTVDMVNSVEARYWKEDFLGIDNVQNNTFYTKTYLSLCKDFCKKVIAKEEDVKEQADFINKSLEFFEMNDTFELDKFSEAVLPTQEYDDKFRQFKQVYEEKRGIETDEDFLIAKDAFKDMKRKFRNLIKLDTKIEIKVQPNPEAPNAVENFMERGFDESKGMYFYKVFFNKEV